MDEKKIIEQINDMTEDVNVPEKLHPENIMNTIREYNAKAEAKDETADNAATPNKDENTGNGKVIPFKHIKKLAALVSAAAVVMVAAIALPNVINNNTPNNEVANEATRIASENVASDSMVIAKTGNVDDYDDVYKELAKYKRPKKSWFERMFSGTGTTNDIFYTDMLVEEAVMETAAVGNVATNGMAGVSDAETGNGMDTNGGYSKTNVQTVGIDEADIIKTDGKYIYYADTDMHTITIYGVDGANTEVLCNLYIEGIGQMNEFYLDGDMLIATGRSFREDKYNVAIVKYDISNREKPEYVGIYEQEGASIVTRKIGNVVYIVTTVRADVNNMKKKEPETFVPSVCGEIIEVEDIYIPEDGTDGNVYTVVSSVDVETMEKIDTAAVLGFSGEFYMGMDSMYIYRTNFSSNGVSEAIIAGYSTDIRRIDYVSENGLIGAVTSGTIPGVIKDSFAINEHNGYLRVMTTSTATYVNNDTTNNVFVLDENLKVVGSIEGLAKGERIYSARYMGDVAYFVTYRETDPLFSVDLSKPEAPKIMGALKIPGFSEYLHGYGDGKLLGIGIEQIKNKNGWMEDYIKLSMFDTTDPYNVTEADKQILMDANYAQALYQYKAVMIDPEKNVFGFVTNSNEGNPSVFRVFSYINGGFVEVVHAQLDDAYSYVTRGVYIGDYVYVVNPEGVTAYSIR